MLARYKVFEEFFGIEKRAALYKVKKEKLNTNDLKVFEKFIHMLSNEEIKEIVSFIDGESPALDIRIKRSKDRHIIKSSVNIVHEKITVAIVDNEIYQTYKVISKKPEQILLEYKNKLDLDKHRREEALRFEEEEHEWVEYCEQLFNDQNDFQSFSAFKCHSEGDNDQAQELEANYHSAPKPPKNVHIIPDYAIFLYAQEIINMLCNKIFEEQIELIIDHITEKNIVQYFLENNDFFTKHLDTIAESLKLHPKLVIHFAKERFTKLFKKFQIDYRF